jgi:hypothetical protein
LSHATVAQVAVQRVSSSAISAKHQLAVDQVKMLCWDSSDLLIGYHCWRESSFMELAKAAEASAFDTDRWGAWPDPPCTGLVQSGRSAPKPGLG